jgi:hypothetical protein
MDGTFIANRYDIGHGKETEIKSAGNLREITDADIAA